MKKLSLFALIVLSLLSLSACAPDAIKPSIVMRDDDFVGGNLSFQFDKTANIIYFGGEGEVVQYYQKDILKGWDEAGNRIGIKFIAPSEIKNFEEAKVSINGEEQIVKNNFKIINGEKVAELTIYPVVNEEYRDFVINLAWQEKNDSENFRVIVKEGTIFMSEE